MRPSSVVALLLFMLIAVSCARTIGATYMADPKPLTPIVSKLKYPVEAVERKLEGRVVVAAYVDTLGNVGEIKIESSTEPMFDAAALDAVRSTKFEPGYFNGQKVAKWFVVPINFTKPTKE